MGGGHSTSVVQDPGLVEELRRYREENQQLMNNYMALVERMQEKHITTIEDLAAHDRKGFEALINLARDTNPIGLNGNNFAFFGLTSAGKSTMINSLIGSEVAQTGAGETTLEIQSYPGTSFVLWDMPGKNDNISYFSMNYIAFWKSLTRRIILITATLKEMSHVCKLLDELGLNYDIVVNKFDVVDSGERNEFKEQIYDEIKQLGLKHARADRVFFVSAKRPNLFSDWLDMVNYLLSGTTPQNQQSNKLNTPKTNENIENNNDESNELCAKCNGTTTRSSPGRITFNKKSYHYNCFVCIVCNKLLSETQTTGFTVTSDGHPRCSQCDLTLAKTCNACNQPILQGNTITFDAKAYHTACFCCERCHKSLANEKGLYTHNSKPYCKTCHNENFAPRCFKCSEPITNQYVTFNNQKYHNTCFVCVKCFRVIGSNESIYNTDLGFVCTTCGA